MKRFVFCLLTAFVAVMSASTEAAIYSQMDPFSPYQPTGETSNPVGLGTFGRLRASYYDTAFGAFNAQSADRFTLGTGMTVTTLDWMGGYSSDPGLPPSTPTFRVGIYTGNAFDSLVPVFESFSLSVVETPQVFANASNFFSYSASLPSVSLTSGTTYWLSIAANFNPVLLNNDYMWGWAFKNQDLNTTGDNFAAYREVIDQNLNYDTWTTNSDLAFRLSSSTEVIPEPSMGIILVTLIGSVVARRRLAKAKKTV